MPVTLLIFLETKLLSYCPKHFVCTKQANPINVTCVQGVVTASSWEHGARVLVLSVKRGIWGTLYLRDYKSLGCRLVRLNRLRSVVGALGALIFLDLNAGTALGVKYQRPTPHTTIK